MSEARGLPSTGITRLHQYYAPLRLPRRPPSQALRRDPHPRGSPLLPVSLNRLAALVTRLQSRQSLTRTARQLPDLSTTVRVEPSSTRETRLAGRTPKFKTGLVPSKSPRSGHSSGRDASRPRPPAGAA